MQTQIIKFCKKIKYPAFFCIFIALEMLLISKVYPIRSQEGVFLCGNFMLLTCVSLIVCLYYDWFKGSEKILYYSCITVAIVAAVSQFWAVCTYAVDIPFDDEWDALPEWSWAWIFKQHNEHRIVFTKLIINFLYEICDWNVRANIILNYFVYLGGIFVLYRILKKTFSNNIFLPLFFLPFFTGFNAQNLLWGFQNQFHFMFLFGLLAVWFGFCKEQKIKNIVLFFIFTALSIFSNNCSFMFGIFVLYVCKFIFEKKHVKKLFLIIPCGLLIFSSFFIHYSFSDGGAPFVYPWKLKFWMFIINLVARGLSGIADTADYYKLANMRLVDSSFLPCYQLMYFVFLAFSLGFVFIKYTKKNHLWPAFAVLFGFASIVFATGLARSSFYVVSQVSPRYAEFFLVVLPVVLSLLYSYKKHYLIKLFFWGQIMLIITGHIAFINTGNFEIEYHKRIQVKDCVTDFYLHNGSGKCLALDNRNYGAQLLKAKDLNLNFVQNLSKE